MQDAITYFITWTTYGTWLPGDSRGWNKRRGGIQAPRPLLDSWSRKRLAEPEVRLNRIQRDKVETACREHAEHRAWILHAVAARSNHVHLAVTCPVAADIARNQFKANASRVLRMDPDALSNDNIWTKGGDTEIVDDEDGLEQVILYINEAQDRKEC